MRNFLFLFACLFFTGCWRPFHEPLLVDIQTSEVAILVETVNDNGQAIIGPNNDSNNSETDFFRNRLVNARKVQIPYYWKQTHRAWLWQDFTTGKWTSAARLIVVDTQPETREWSEDSEAIWVESKDSIGFSTGISITARIDNKEDAVKFLSNYPPKNMREITTSGGDPFSVEIASLEQIMDKEVRIKIQEVFADEAASFDMDELRGRKKEVMANIRELVVPYFKERGITITTIGQFGGFDYQNPNTQLAIDKVFQAQQDQEVAKAEAKAAEERKLALKLAGEGEASKILESKKGEAEAIKLVADAKAYELEKLNQNPEAYLRLKQLEVKMKEIEKWSGDWPRVLFGGSEAPMMMMNMDSLSKE
jgi:regulator of protease activity HflC (stomatin/prohibitin superfamily)